MSVVMAALAVMVVGLLVIRFVKPALPVVQGLALVGLCVVLAVNFLAGSHAVSIWWLLTPFALAELVHMVMLGVFGTRLGSVNQGVLLFLGIFPWHSGAWNSMLFLVVLALALIVGGVVVTLRGRASQGMRGSELLSRPRRGTTSEGVPVASSERGPTVVTLPSVGRMYLSLPTVFAALVVAASIAFG